MNVKYTKKYFLLILITFFSFGVNAQEHIGDDMLNWVRNELPKTSVDFMTADYLSRINNYLIAFHQTAYQLIDSLGMTVTNISKHIAEKENEYSSQPTLKAAIWRQRDADSILQLVRRYNSDISTIALQLNSLQSLSARDFYVLKGLYHIGRSTLFESLIPSLNSMRDDLPRRYGFAIQLQVSEDGSVSYPKATSESVSSEEAAAQTIIIAESYNFPPYGPAVAYTAVILYDLFKGYSKYEELKEQQDKMNEALSLLPVEFPSEETSYQIYKAQFDKVVDSFKTVNDSLSSLFLTMQNMLKPLYAYNYARLKISNEILTNEKIEYLKSEYLNNNSSIQNIFNNSLLLRQFSDMVLLNKEKDSLKTASLVAKRDLNGFKSYENYEEDLKEYYSILKVLRSKYEYIPMWNYLDGKLTQKSKDSADLLSIKQKIFRNQKKGLSTTKTNLNAFVSTEFLKNEMFIQAALKGLKTSHLDESTYALIKHIKKGSAFRFELNSIQPQQSLRKTELDVDTTKSMKKAKNLVTTEKFPFSENNLNEPSHFGYIGRDGATIVYCNNGCDLYNMPNGGLSPGDLFSSSYDGAYQKQVAIAQREVNEMKSNIKLRITTMENANVTLSSTLPKWRLENIKNINSFKSNVILNILPNMNAAYAKYFAGNLKLLEASRVRFDDFMNNNLSNRSISEMELQVGISKQITSEIQPEDIRPEGVNVEGINIRRQYENDNPYAAQIEHEKLKTEATISYVEKRIQDEKVKGVNDPVFNDVRFFYDLARQSSSDLRDAERCLDKYSDLYLKNKAFAEELCENYIGKAKQIRAYALGYLETYKVPDKYFINPQTLYNEIRSNLDKYSTCNIPIGIDLEKSACNRYVGYALRDVYGFEDFINVPSSSDAGENGISFLNTTDLENFILKSANWHLIGSAIDQEALRESGFYAAQGHAVIALGAGHVTLILPSEFIHSKSWKLWVPETVMFALNKKERKPIYKYDVPLSRQWTAKDAAKVRIFYRDLH